MSKANTNLRSTRGSSSLLALLMALALPACGAPPEMRAKASPPANYNSSQREGSDSIDGSFTLSAMQASDPYISNPQSLTDAQQSELSKIKAQILALPIKDKFSDPKDPKNALEYSFGATGLNIENVAAYYELTKDRDVMNRLIEYADAMLAHRNDQPAGFSVKAYNGKVALCWLFDQPGAACGPEQGDTISHIALVAKLIAQSPILTNRPVSGPDTFGYNKLYPKYGQRAHFYIDELVKSLDTYFTPTFVRASDNRMYFPNNALFAKAGEAVDWNQQLLGVGGYQRVAETLEIWGEDRTHVRAYDAVAKASTDWFVSVATPVKIGTSQAYSWRLRVGGRLEDIVHAQHDVRSLFRAYRRDQYAISAATMKSFANSFALLMLKDETGPNGEVYKVFSGQTDGTTREDLKTYSVTTGSAHFKPKVAMSVGAAIPYAIFVPGLERFVVDSANPNVEMVTKKIWNQYYKAKGIH